MPTINLVFKYPKFIQEAIHCDVKFVCIKAGRRVGKTFNATQWICEELMDEKRTGLWIDTTQSNITKYVDRYFRPILKPIWHLMHWNAQKYVLTFPNGSYIDFGSSEKPENLEGFEYDRGILNEAGIILKKSSLWDNTLQPMFKGSKTRVKIIGTPKGKNKYHQLFNLGLDGQETNYKSFSFTAYDSQYWDAKELESIKPKIPQEVWNQEYMADFIDGSGSVFRKINQCVTQECYDKPKEGVEYVLSADLAKHQDFTVIYIAEKESKKVIFQDRFNKIDWGFQKARIKALYHKFNCVEGIVDSTGVGDAIYDDLVAMGLNIRSFKFTSSTKNQLVQNLSIAIDNHEISYFAFPELISELEIYGYEVSAMGNIRYNAPDGFHDDCVMGLGLINILLNSTSVADIWERYLNNNL
jgi:Terminase large subunit, T4likevirus-type, N-terminal